MRGCATRTGAAIQHPCRQCRTSRPKAQVMMPEETNLTVETLLELLLIVLLVAIAVKRVRVPYTVALVLAGLVLGLLPQFAGIELTPELILTIFLPVLLFEGAYNVPATRLRRNLLPIALLAVPGILLSSGVTAALVHYILGLDWQLAFLFGALVSATDPIAVLALFRQLGAPHRLSVIVEGESLFNDGVAFVLFTIVLESIRTGVFSLTEGVLDFMITVAGAMAIGLVIGFGGSFILKAIDDYLVEISATFAGAYGAFLLAERFHFSGVIAVVVAGLLFGNYGSPNAMTPRTNYALSATWEFAGFLANSLIFLLIGLALDPETLTGIIWPVVFAFAATLLARALSIYTLTPLIRGGMAIPLAFRHVMFWGGLRGALSLALVLSLPFTLPGGDPFPDRGLLQGMTFGVVGLSLLVQGLTMSPLLKRLGLIREKQGVSEYEVTQGRLVAAEVAASRLEQQHQRGEISEVEFQRLSAAYERQQERLKQKLESLAKPPDAPGPPEQDRAAAHTRAMAEKSALERLYRDGVISEETLARLDEEIDVQLSTEESAQG